MLVIGLPCLASPCTRLLVPSRGREVEGQVLIAQEHQPSPPEPDVRLVTASGSHGISYVFVVGAQVSVRSSVTRPSQPPKIEADSLESFLPILLVG